MSIQEKIQQIITDNKVVLFMKGTADFPQCGFSGKVAHILNLCEINFHDVNVLEDPEMRQGIKDFSNWPTIPQLYINGEFVGGCDIVTQLYENGELQKQLA
ncbi:MAG: Grx4 family monothiol glutaredoxin [Coxiellaceae bacterium]|nr:Grx4 family monothiol glutaredoxin [Coxiellaceae bacterium]